MRPLLEPYQKKEEELARKRSGWRVAEAGMGWPWGGHDRQAGAGLWRAGVGFIQESECSGM